MKLLLDTSVWVEHLRHATLASILPRLLGRHSLWMSGVVAAELQAGCRARAERRVVDDMIEPFRRAGRLVVPDALATVEAGRALSRLREKGLTLAGPGGALLDALVAVTGWRLGALVVSHNAADHRRLASVMPFEFATFDEWSRSLDP